MATVRREHAQRSPHCAYCGQPVATGQPAIERFGELFCSEWHAEEFTAGVRAARVDAAARRAASEPAASGYSQRAPGGRVGAWIAGAVIVGFLGIALTWGSLGGGAVTPGAGSLITALLLLACPLAMYFMMRGMNRMGSGHDADGPRVEPARKTDDTRPSRPRPS